MSWPTAELEGKKKKNRTNSRLAIFAVASSQNDIRQSLEAGLELDIKGGAQGAAQPLRLFCLPLVMLQEPRFSVRVLSGSSVCTMASLLQIKSIAVELIVTRRSAGGRAPFIALPLSPSNKLNAFLTGRAKLNNQAA